MIHTLPDRFCEPAYRLHIFDKNRGNVNKVIIMAKKATKIPASEVVSCAMLKGIQQIHKTRGDAVYPHQPCQDAGEAGIPDETASTVRRNRRSLYPD